MKENRVYLLNFPRPTGIEPTVYLYKPNIKPEVVEVEPGYFLEDPYSNPDVLEFNSIKEAVLYIVDWNGDTEYLKHLKIKENK
jgi:hypothetical protein